MIVLHINSYYPSSDLYRQMLLHFEPESGCSHVVYVPIAADRDATVRSVAPADVSVVYSADYHHLDRWHYHGKRLKIVRSLERQIDLLKVSAIHAHHLFTAGGVAYELKRRYGVPYVVAVRNTDINWFFRYALHLRSMGLTILQEASRVVFISPSGLEGLRNYVPCSQWPSVVAKSVIIPNGVDDYWLDNSHQQQSHLVKDRIKILYVGQMTRNKNVETVISVSNELERRGYPTEAYIVGDGPDTKRIRRMAQRSRAPVRMVGRVDSKTELIRLYRSSNVFVMPSFTETFGLAYIEAMSQGLPVICSRGQGIDGFFEDGNIGYACDSRNYKQMASRIIDIVERLSEMSRRCTSAAQRFSWSKIVKEYAALYEAVENDA